LFVYTEECQLKRNENSGGPTRRHPPSLHAGVVVPKKANTETVAFSDEHYKTHSRPNEQFSNTPSQSSNPPRRNKYRVQSK